MIPKLNKMTCIDMSIAANPETIAYASGSKPFMAKNIILITLPIMWSSVISCAAVKKGTNTNDMENPIKNTTMVNNVRLGTSANIR